MVYKQFANVALKNLRLGRLINHGRYSLTINIVDYQAEEKFYLDWSDPVPVGTSHSLSSTDYFRYNNEGRIFNFLFWRAF